MKVHAVERGLRELGWRFDRWSGNNHQVWLAPDGRQIVVSTTGGHGRKADAHPAAVREYRRLAQARAGRS